MQQEKGEKNCCFHVVIPAIKIQIVFENFLFKNNLTLQKKAEYFWGGVIIKKLKKRSSK